MLRIIIITGLTLQLYCVDVLLAQDLKISGDYQEVSLKEILDDLELRYPVRFYYLDEWLPVKIMYKVPLSEPKAVLPKIPDATYLTSNFKQIYTFEQFINEAIQNVKVRELDSTKTVRLFNREQGRLFEDHPWYLVDEFLTFNESEVLQIPYQDIVEVRLYYKAATLEKYFSGFMRRGGVMEIITRDVKYVRKLKSNPNMVEIEGYATPHNFSASLHTNNNRHVPDLRGTIYWTPQVPVDSNGSGRITIPLSDDTGDFAIVIMGLNHLNQPIVGYNTYGVNIANSNE